MLDLILIGCFTAFMLAVIEPLVSILSIFISNRVTNAISSISFSSVACWLVEISTTKGVVLYAVSGAFLGSALLAIVERVAVYKPAVINATRPE
jgi:hypothetical protein